MKRKNRIGWMAARNMFMVVANYVMAAVFFFCVVVQYNDPDPVQWMTIYGLGTIACILYLTRKLKWYISGAIGLAALIWAATILPDVLGKPTDWPHVFGTMHMISPTVENTREIGGLLIVACWMFILTAAVRRR